MKHWMLLFTLILTACTSASAPDDQPGKANYPDLGIAPELAGDVWINTDAPPRLADLRGKVVLLEMWTYG